MVRCSENPKALPLSLGFHAGREIEQRIDVAVDDGEVDDLRVIHGASDARVGGVHQWGVGGDRNALGKRADFQHGIYARGAVDVQHHAGLRELLEIRGVHLHPVGTRGQQPDGVPAGVVGSGLAAEVGIHVGGGDGDAGHDRAGAIRDGAENGCAGDLRPQCQNRNERAENGDANPGHKDLPSLMYEQ